MRAALVMRRSVVAAGLAAALPGFLFGDPGFGSLHKRKIDLPIRQPAAIRLANTLFAVTGSSANPAYVPVQESLMATLETELIANEHTLIKKPPASAEWVLGLRVTGFSLPPPQQRTDNVGNSAVAHVRWTGSIHAAYQVLDHDGRAHDAGNVEYNYDKEFVAGAKTGSSVFNKVPIPGVKKQAPSEVPQTTEDVQQILIREVVKQIATKLGNTKQTLEVQIAAGDDHLNRAADFMEKRLWSRALEELDKMPGFPKPESEAYRQYDLGLAYEAMSYEASSFNEQRENLFKAAEYYDKALEMNQKERYFIETVARTKEAIARYKAFEGMQKEDRKKEAPRVVVAQNEPPKVQAPLVQSAAQTTVQPPAAQPPTAQPPAAQTPAAQTPKPPPPQPPKPLAPKPQASVPSAAPSTAKAPAAAKAPPAKAAAPKALTISDVIEMFSSGVPEDQIAAIIQRSSVQFDPFDKDTAIAIAKAKLPVTLQNEMRKKVGAPQLAPVATKK